MATTDLPRALTGALRGRILLPGDERYETARRVWNGAVDTRPAAVVRCTDVTDVQLAVRMAGALGIPLSVRGGGHDWAGRAVQDSALVLDLSLLRGAALNLGTRMATVGGGSTARDLLTTTQPHGLAPVTGTVGAVGLVGLTLAGGYGPLIGRYGLALDNLTDAEVVLADGSCVRADDDPDLLWMLRGAGGAVGVVTSATYLVHPLTTVLAGLVLFPLGHAARVLRRYAEVIASAPDELTVIAGFLTGPDGDPLLFLFPTWCGDPAKGEQVVAGLAGLGPAVSADVGPMPYGDAIRMFDAQVVNGRHYAIRTRWLPGLDPNSTAVLVAAGSTLTSPYSLLVLHHFHGAAARVPSTATAFALRRDHLLVELVSAWDPGDGRRHREWTDTYSRALAPFSLPGGYPNLLGPDEAERALTAYGRNGPKVVALARRYDPDGVFGAAVPTLPRDLS
jgi:hypothetical protein